MIAEQAVRLVGHDIVRTHGSEGNAAEPEVSDEDAEAGDYAEAVVPSERVGGEGTGWRWVNWVRDGLREGAMEVNADGGWLHNIAGEAYVVVPDGFKTFAALEEVEPKTVKNRVARLGRHRERSFRKGAAKMFRAELADGRRVEGMVFPGELLWDGDPPWAAD